MAITLRPEHEQAIAKVIESGHYENADQVIEHALELLKWEEEFSEVDLDKEELEARLNRADAQLERGEFFTEEEVWPELERRKALALSQREKR